MASTEAVHGDYKQCSIARSSYIQDAIISAQRPNYFDLLEKPTYVKNTENYNERLRQLLPPVYNLERTINDVELEDQTKIGLESKGIYGWWQSSSASPCPSKITFSCPQRRIMQVGDRINEVEKTELVKHSLEIQGIHNHTEIAELLRNEEKMKGLRCYCDGGGNSHSLGFAARGANGLIQYNFDQLQKPFILATNLFKLAAHGDIEPLAMTSDVKKVVLYSTLAWYIFDYEAIGENSNANHYPANQSKLIESIDKSYNIFNTTKKLVDNFLQPVITNKVIKENIYETNTKHVFATANDYYKLYNIRVEENSIVDKFKNIYNKVYEIINVKPITTKVNLLTCYDDSYSNTNANIMKHKLKTSKNKLSTQSNTQASVKNCNQDEICRKVVSNKKEISTELSDKCSHRTYKDYVVHDKFIPNTNLLKTNPQIIYEEDQLKTKPLEATNMKLNGNSSNPDLSQKNDKKNEMLKNAQVAKEREEYDSIAVGIQKKNLDECPVTAISNNEIYSFNKILKYRVNNQLPELRKQLAEQNSNNTAVFGSDYASSTDQYCNKEHSQNNFYTTIKNAYNHLKRAYKNALCSQSDYWISKNIRPTPNTVKKMKLILRDIYLKEIEIKKRSVGLKTPYRIGLSDFASIVIPHMSAKVLGEDLKKYMLSIASSDENRKITDIKDIVDNEVKETEFYKVKEKTFDTYSIDNYLGYNISAYTGKFADITEKFELKPLIYTIEPPGASVGELLDPIKSQVKRRIKQFTQQMEKAPYHATTDDIEYILNADKQDGNAIEWWKLSKNERDEIRQMQKNLASEFHYIQKLKNTYDRTIEPKEISKTNVNLKTHELEPRTRDCYANCEYKPIAYPKNITNDCYGANLIDPTMYLGQPTNYLNNSNNRLNIDRVQPINSYDDGIKLKKPRLYGERNTSPPTICEINNIFTKSFEE